MGSNGSEHRARIGLPTYVERARWGSWDRPAALLPTSYVAQVLAAGAVPVLLPPAPTHVAVDALRGIDGLALTGGSDIDPSRYGADAHRLGGAPCPERDEWESALLDGALEHDLPVLAICRGMQLLNVRRGGTLVQHLPDRCRHDRHRPEPGVFGTVDVEVYEDSRLHGIVGRTATVACHHHQAIDRLGTGLSVAAVADDGVIEAVELADARFVVGVQWHEEEGADPRLFEAFVREAQA